MHTVIWITLNATVNGLVCFTQFTGHSSPSAKTCAVPTDPVTWPSILAQAVLVTAHTIAASWTLWEHTHTHTNLTYNLYNKDKDLYLMTIQMSMILAWEINIF